MSLKLTRLPMVFEVENFAQEDPRGSFQRVWCAEAFASARIDFAPTQASRSTNIACHTLRGMHWQVPPMPNKSWCAVFWGGSGMWRLTCALTARHFGIGTRSH